MNNFAIKKWAIVSWHYADLGAECYGRLMEFYEGSYEGACQHTRETYMPDYNPLSVCGIIEP